MHAVEPLDERAVIQAGLKTAVVLTVEEHSEVGGLGSAVADVLLRAGYRGIFRKLALPDRFSSVAGDYDYLRTLGGLDVKSIASAVREAVATKMDYTILDDGMVPKTHTPPSL